MTTVILPPDLIIAPEKRALLEGLVDQLRKVKNLVAIVLGGSYASCTHHAESDLDVGLYYFESQPFAIADIRRIAQATGEAPTVTDYYGWGAWVNGGAWIHTPHGKVDFLYRNIDQVQRTIKEAEAGIVQHDYDQQPAYGFYSTIYLAETQVCIPLYDPQGVIAQFKHQVEIYPPKLKQAIISNSLWSAEFTLHHARGFAAQGDIYNTVGCLARAASNLTQVLFALNEKYFMRDKKVFNSIASFEHLPPGYIQQINHILAHPGESAEELHQSVAALAEAWRGVAALPGIIYKPNFQL